MGENAIEMTLGSNGKSRGRSCPVQASEAKSMDHASGAS
ncbi:hypothetical protein PVAP13_2NG651400 [Panicum virgatum]|uniref:Uncharacterized protein n=1 Tax=Panicum virgatum TaxID=38727 RepID=A0A8T0VUU5_PANVG|nr:hypothetical protein PVAP13_2NG651400 [Panicum virgatum]